MRHDLLSLEVFLQVAQQRNLTRAAEDCHLATSAVSKRISELEDRIGSSLFIRNSRGMELTPAGQSLLYHVRQLKVALSKMDNELSEYSNGVKGNIRIHAITSALAQHLTLDISAFLKQYPLIRFDIEERVGTEVVRAVSDGRADIGIIAETTPSLGLEVKHYRNDELVLTVSAEHPLASFEKVKFSEAIRYEFIGLPAESSVAMLLSQKAQESALIIQQRVQASSFECVCRMASTNLGVGVLPREVLTFYEGSLNLRPVHIDENWAHRRLLIVCRDFDLLPPTAKSFVEHSTV